MELIAPGDLKSSKSLLGLCWGKADASVCERPHPVLLHMLDVAAVAFELIVGERLSSRTISSLLSNQIRLAELVFLIALHDIGKISPGFQAKVPKLAARLHSLGLRFLPLSNDGNHGAVGAAVLPSLLTARGATDEFATLAAGAVVSHHGSFLPLRIRVTSAAHGDASWAALREEAVATLVATLGVDVARLQAVPNEGWLMQLAGLTVLADWIGSDTRFFPYAEGVVADAAYFEGACLQAQHALDELGFRRKESWQPQAFDRLFPSYVPNAMQRAVIELSEAANEPSLIVVEAPTGGGKTEAALYAASQMMARFGLNGLYVALPTQATSNQMLGRLRQWLGYNRRETVNLQLLHSGSTLQPDFRVLLARAVMDDQTTHRAHADVAAEAWFTEKKRGLLAPYAVGTIDQAMMGVLRSKHFFLRLFGLAGKVVIIDEVHAYDAFMSQILDRLLGWLRELGVSAILLSATLPRGRRQELVAAWQGGAQKSVDAPASTPYPRALLVGRGEQRELAIDRSDDMVRQLSLRHVRPKATGFDAMTEIAQELISVLPNGCAAWIHNTVGEAQAAFEALREAGLPHSESLLIHARYPQAERVAREQQLLMALGPHARRPQRLIVVATQVIEQSLDIDVDLMLTALAPVDLLIQRAGRLHRHRHRDAVRPEAHRRPVMWLIGRALDSAPAAFGASGHVYAQHVLMRSEFVLARREGWRLPEQADELIEAVYPDVHRLDGIPEELPAQLHAAWLESAKELQAAIHLARGKGSSQLVPAPCTPEDGESFMDLVATNTLKDPEEAPRLHADALARTRDIDQSVTLLCLHQNKEGRRFVGEQELTVDLTAAVPLPSELVRSLLERTICVQHPKIVSRIGVIPPPEAFLRTAALRHAHPVWFDDDGYAHGDDWTMHLCTVRGLRINPKENL